MLFNIDFRSIPEVTMIGMTKQSSGWCHKGRYSRANILLFITSGESTFLIEGREISLTTGDCLLIPYNTFYTASTKNECEYSFIHFKLQKPICGYTEEEGFNIVQNIRKRLKGTTEVAPYKLNPTTYDGIFLRDKITLGDKENSVLHMVSKCDNLRYEKSINRKLQIDIYFAQLLMLLSSISIEDAINEKPVPAALLKILLYIQQNFHHNITLEDISYNFKLSKQYIIRLFKQHLNTTVTNYINSLKLFNSLELLKYSTMNIGEVAAFLGFNNAYYFSRMFKKAYHLTPSEFIKSELNYSIKPE